jgi:hypothetical protein
VPVLGGRPLDLAFVQMGSHNSKPEQSISEPGPARGETWTAEAATAEEVASAQGAVAERVGTNSANARGSSSVGSVERPGAGGSQTTEMVVKGTPSTSSVVQGPGSHAGSTRRISSLAEISKILISDALLRPRCIYALRSDCIAARLRTPGKRKLFSETQVRWMLGAVRHRNFELVVVLVLVLANVFLAFIFYIDPFERRFGALSAVIGLVFFVLAAPLVVLGLLTLQVPILKCSLFRFDYALNLYQAIFAGICFSVCFRGSTWAKAWIMMVLVVFYGVVSGVVHALQLRHRALIMLELSLSCARGNLPPTHRYIHAPTCSLTLAYLLPRVPYLWRPRGNDSPRRRV